MGKQGKKTNAKRVSPKKAQEKFYPPLDEGIKKYVEILRSGGIETYESCQGGEGHASPEPMVRFHGDHSEGFKALAVALQHGLPIFSLRRVYSIQDLQPVGPYWEIVFYEKAG